jgi:hypothetical protein
MRNKPDPLSCDLIYSERNLQNGLYIAEQYLGFSLQDITLLFRHSRPAAIGYLSQLGAVLNPDGSTGTIPAAAGKLRKLLGEAREVAIENCGK